MPVLPVSLIATVLLEAEAPLDELELKVRASDLMAHFEGRGAKLYLPRGDRDYAFHVGLRMLALRHLVEERDGPVRGGRRPSGPCSPTTPTPSPICADDASTKLWQISYSARLRLLHQPAVDLGRGDGLLHDVRARPDHDLQHRHRRAVRRQADGAAGDLRCAEHRAWQPDQLQGIQRFASQDLFRGGGLAAIIGALVLVYTGSRVFVELDDSINAIWAAATALHPAAPASGAGQPAVATAGAG